MHHRIFRPSILIGQPTEGRGRGGLGRFLDLTHAFHRAVVARDPGYFERHALKVCASREATINLVRVDQAIAEMIDLAGAGSATFNQIFHITNEASLGVFDMLQTILPMVGIPRVEIAGRDSELGPVDRLFRRSMRFFSPYLHDRTVFDRSNVARFEVEDRWAPTLIDLARLRAIVTNHRGLPVAAPIFDLGLEPGPGCGLGEMVA
jgi:hypothetical protein